MKLESKGKRYFIAFIFLLLITASFMLMLFSEKEFWKIFWVIFVIIFAGILVAKTFLEILKRKKFS